MHAAVLAMFEQNSNGTNGAATREEDLKLKQDGGQELISGKNLSAVLNFTSYNCGAHTVICIEVFLYHRPEYVDACRQLPFPAPLVLSPTGVHFSS